MVHVAFLRNVNQGQRGHPSTADLTGAFARAGAVDAAPFQSNGTVVFSSAHPAVVAAEARSLLAASGTFDDAVHVRPLSFVEALVDEYADRDDFSRYELTLFPEDRTLDDLSTLAAAATRGRCSAVEHGDGWAVIRNDRDRQSNGTPVVEAVLHEPATSRGFATLLRLVDRFAV